MGWPVNVVEAGGLPVSEAPEGQGVLIDAAPDGFGYPVTIVEDGGIPVAFGEGLGAPLPGLSLTFSDTFTTLSLRTGGPTQEGYAGGEGTWTPRLNHIADAKGSTLDANGEYQFYPDPDYLDVGQFAITSEGLRIRAQTLEDAEIADDGTIPDRPTTTDPYPYVSGILTSKHSFSQQGGYFEIICRFDAGKATWPGFWMLAANGGYPPELDVMEHNGDWPTTWTGNVHTAGGVSDPQLVDMEIDLGDEFHTYAVDWTSDTLTWYVDGEEVASADVSDKPDLQTPLYMLLNMAIGSTSPGWVSPPDGTTPSPADLVVKRVRAWQRPGPNSLSLSNTAILDDAGIGDVVATLSATVFGSDTALTYSILEDADNKFTIVGDELRLADTVSYLAAGSHLVRLRVEDSAGRYWDRLVTIAVLEAEPTAPNLLTAGDDFSNAAWAKDRCTIADAGTADQAIKETATTGDHAVIQTISKAASSVSYRFMADVEGGLGRDWIRLGAYDGDWSAAAIAFYDIATGAIGGYYADTGFTIIGTPSVTLLPNGKYRCVLDFISNANAQLIPLIVVASADGTTSYAGDISKGIYVTRVRLEAL